MRSRIFECRVMHERFQPRRHRFDYRMFMLAIDLDEYAVLARRLRLLGINRRGFFSVREQDYLPLQEPTHNPTSGDPENVSQPAGRTAGTLRGRVEQFLRQGGVSGKLARIELITMPRIAGYGFNPVSFYFCHDDAGRPLAAIAEVTNTFGEIKPFLLGPQCWTNGVFRLRVPKHFYVSPFSDVDVDFDFRLRPADKDLAVCIDDFEAGERTLTSVLTGRARPLRDRTLLWFTVKYPLLTLRVIAAIHWHAFRLWMKHVPWFAKAARPSGQRDLFRPHHTLTRQTPSKS